MERLISMMLRRVIGKLMREGVAKGINPDASPSPEAEKQAQMTASAKRSQQLMRLGRRIGKL